MEVVKHEMPVKRTIYMFIFSVEQFEHSNRKGQVPNSLLSVVLIFVVDLWNENQRECGKDQFHALVSLFPPLLSQCLLVRYIRNSLRPSVESLVGEY